jgi:hypothetical protein
MIGALSLLYCNDNDRNSVSTVHESLPLPIFLSKALLEWRVYSIFLTLFLSLSLPLPLSVPLSCLRSVVNSIFTTQKALLAWRVYSVSVLRSVMRREAPV